MTIGIYKISHKYTGECLYVGQSANIEQRWTNHKKEIRTLRHRQKGLIDIYKTYGMKVFDFVVLEEVAKKDLNSRELFYFDQLTPQFYGQIPSEKNRYQQSEETRKKISDSLKARTKIHDEKQKAKFLAISEDVRKYAYDVSKSKKDCCLDFQISYRALGNILRYYNIDWVVPASIKKQNRTANKRIIFQYEHQKCDFCNTSIKLESEYQRRKFKAGLTLCCSRECYYELNSIVKNLPNEAELEFLYWHKRYTLREIAKLYNTSDPVILKRMEHYSIPRRDKNYLRFKIS